MKYKIPKKIMKIYIRSQADMWVAKKLIGSSLFKILAKKYYISSKEKQLEFMLKSIELHPHLEANYDSCKSMVIDINIGFIKTDKK